MSVALAPTASAAPSVWVMPDLQGMNLAKAQELYSSTVGPERSLAGVHQQCRPVRRFGALAVGLGGLQAVAVAGPQDQRQVVDGGCRQPTGAVLSSPVVPR